MKRFLLLLSLLAVLSPLMADDRSVDELKDIAYEFLSTRQIMPNTITRSNTIVDIVKDKNALTIMGVGDLGLVVLAKDKSITPVMGYTENGKNEMPPAFQWWLDGVDDFLSTHPQPSQVNSAVPSNYKSHVDPLLETTWGQDTPYNQKCPYEEGTCVFAPSGCVPTALYYHKHPKTYGQGSHSYVSTPKNGQSFTVSFDFEHTVFDWNNMLVNYTYQPQNYTEMQADAVSTLVLACGVMCEAQYLHDDSGTIGNVGLGCDGLKNYLGYTPAYTFWRDDPLLSDDEWLDIIYSNISRDLPVLYSGSPTNPKEYGHCFIIDGYDAHGLVHVNWGWNGYYDGYFNIDALKPSEGNDFTQDQYMHCEIMPDDGRLIYKEIEVSKPGTLSSLLPREDWYNVDTLKVTGQLNGDDLRTLSAMTGSSFFKMGKYRLLHLDLQDVTIVAGGEDGSTQGEDYYSSSKADRITSYAFNNCGGLLSIVLPLNLKEIGRFSFYFCNIPSIKIPKGVTKIESYGLSCPWTLSEIVFEEGSQLNTIGDYAFSANPIEVIDIPASVENLGEGVFSKCSSLRQVHFTEDSKLKEIKSGTFADTAIETLELPSSIENLDAQAISNCPKLTSIYFPIDSKLKRMPYFSGAKNLETIFIPSHVENIAENAFAYCSKLSAVYSMMEDPISIRKNIFEIVDVDTGQKEFTKATLYVPKGTKSTYESVPVWKDFSKIVEYDPTGIKSVLLPQSTFDVYNIQGQKIRQRTNSLHELKRGVYIVNGKKVYVK